MPRDTPENNGPKIPIPGVAGEAIYTALQRMAMQPAECAITIRKERLPGGGYSYSISNQVTPQRGRPQAGS